MQQLRHFDNTLKWIKAKYALCFSLLFKEGRHSLSLATSLKWQNGKTKREAQWWNKTYIL